MSVQQEPSTPVAVMSLQPAPEAAPLKPKSPPTPAELLRAQLTPVIAVSVSAAVLMGATLWWASTYAPGATVPVEIDADDYAAKDGLDVLFAVRERLPERFDETALPPLQAMAGTTRLGPRATGGGPGVLILGVAPGSAMERTGLTGGDHITAINGVSLDLRTTGKELYEETDDAVDLVIEAVRRGRPLVVRYNNHVIVASGALP